MAAHPSRSSAAPCWGRMTKARCSKLTKARSFCSGHRSLTTGVQRLAFYFLLVAIGFLWPLALGAFHIFGFKFSLRTLLILITIVSLLLGLLACALRA